MTGPILLPGMATSFRAEKALGSANMVMTELGAAGDGASGGFGAMVQPAVVIASMLALSMLADCLIRPRADGRWPGRSAAGWTIHALLMLAGLGLFLGISGHLAVSALLVTALMAALALVSNAKNAVLGEPLLFSDLALVGAVFRHRQFYLSALKAWQIVLLAAGAVALCALLAWAFVPILAPHLVGMLAMGSALATVMVLLTLPPWQQLARVADADADVKRHGLLATMVLHAQRWRQSTDPPGAREPLIVRDGTELIVIVQAESFVDPAELFGDERLALPGLAAARDRACRHGRLMVSGFGAYTMRTEFGVIFGRSEAQLGFRRFDPFLTAAGEASHGLPARLKPAGWQSLFVHPHDLGFYGRDRLMPLAGFDAMIGEAAFEAKAYDGGRYVTDAALAAQIGELAGAAAGPTLIYAVSIENHGPWPADAGSAKSSSAYIRLARNSDAMLSGLIDTLQALHRPSLLVFFGDHRPSIPGLSMPGGDRHTPYVILRFDAQGDVRASGQPPSDLSPAGLHHALLAELSGG
jgi:hypothetical protein